MRHIAIIMGAVEHAIKARESAKAHPDLLSAEPITP